MHALPRCFLLRSLLRCILLFTACALPCSSAQAFKGEFMESLIREGLGRVMETEAWDKTGLKKTAPHGFYRLCAFGTPEEVQKAIDGGVDPTIPDAERGQTTALHDAAAFNTDPRVTALLVKAGVNINAQGERYGRTALHMAILNNPNAPAIIAELAKGNPDYYIMDNQLRYPLYTAINGKVERKTRLYLIPDNDVVLALLDAYPEYAQEKGHNPLGDNNPLGYYMKAYLMGGGHNPEHIRPSITVIQRFLKYGADPSGTSSGGGNMQEPHLFKAIGFDSQGDLTEDIYTRVFLEAGADVQGKGPFGKGALSVAIQHHNIPAINALLSYDKTLVSSRDDYLETPLHFMAEWDTEIMPEAGKILLDAGADINSKSKSGATPFLNLASAVGIPKAPFKADEEYRKGVDIRKKAVEFFITHGADVKATDNKGKGAIHILCTATVLSKDDIQTFLDAGLDINARDNNGNTPLMYFVAMSSESTWNYDEGRPEKFTVNMKKLQELGANPALMNVYGEKAYSMMHKKFMGKAPEAIEFLKMPGPVKPTP